MLGRAVFVCKLIRRMVSSASSDILVKNTATFSGLHGMLLLSEFAQLKVASLGPSWPVEARDR